MENIKLTYDDVTIVPSVITNIESRKECNPYNEDGFLPIIASCMSSVVSFANARNFNENKVRVVIPRSYSIDDRLWYFLNNHPNFVAFSLQEVKEYFIDQYCLLGNSKYRICIDLANGHMKSLIDTASTLKNIYGNKLLIMTGNIANPETYKLYESAGIDYVRVSIGTGNVCSTSSNTGVHYPVFSLLEQIYKIKESIKGKCKIIADGGIKGFRDIQKALIYADYVMIGSLFNKTIESAGKTTYGNFYWNIRGKKLLRPLKTLFYFGKEVPYTKQKEVMELIKKGKVDVWKEFFGMSTKIAQALINEANNQNTKKLKTSEGLLKYQKVEYDLSGWIENEIDYLRSAMSYTNSRTLKEYKNSNWVKISKIAYNL